MRLTLTMMLLLGVAGAVSWAQSIDFDSVRFVPRSEDPNSDVTVSGDLGSVFAGQNVKFQFSFTVLSGIASSFSLKVTALTVPTQEGEMQQRIEIFPSSDTGVQQLFCQTGTTTTDFNAVSTVPCTDVSVQPAPINVTVVRVGFDVALMTDVTGQQFGEFDLFAEIEFDNGTIVQTLNDKLLRLQVSGEMAVDLAIEGPVVLDPETPSQGERVTLTFFIVNNSFENSGLINTLDFDLQVPSSSTFTPTTFLELNCFIQGENSADTSCGNLPIEIDSGERKRVQIQFLTSQLPPTLGDNVYLLRMIVNQTSREQEGGSEFARNNNIFIVNFMVAQPERDVIVVILEGPARVFQGTDAAFSFAVSNQSPLVLTNNRWCFELEREDPNSGQFEPFDASSAFCLEDGPLTREQISNGETVDADRFACDPNPDDADPEETCNRFDLFIAETKRFALEITTDDLVEEPLDSALYRLTIRLVGPLFQQAAGDFSQASIRFVVEGGDGTTPPDRPEDVFLPELRPTQLQIVPSATVEVGTTLVLSSTIKNSGNREANNIEVLFRLERDGTQSADDVFDPIEFVHFFPRLGVGLELEARQAFETETIPPGSYRLRVEVRMRDVSAGELDPNNNVIEAIINVIEKSNSEDNG